MKQYQDYYFKKAKQENYPARSVYKLQEINNKFKILKTGQKVLDLGAAPGSWTLFCSKKIGPRGQLVAIDLKPIEIALPKWVVTFQGDVFDPDPEITAYLEQVAPFDLVLSDMAPKTTGVKFADQARSYELAQEAFFVAQKWLKKGGHFVVKIFTGPDVSSLQQELRQVFQQVKQFKPKSSRQESKETFLVGLRKK
ncbi:MAG: RlmE family RNA methyltransferase [Desulfonauticus sp.]|nr:RlmE family RNA methyltransferase [Desulfonauticus sp.]